MNTPPNLTPKAKEMLQLAATIADQAGCAFVGIEHILIAMIRFRHGVTGMVLNDAKVTEEKVQAILRS